MILFESYTDGFPFFQKEGDTAGFVVHPQAANARGIPDRGRFPVPVRQEADLPGFGQACTSQRHSY